MLWFMMMSWVPVVRDMSLAAVDASLTFSVFHYPFLLERKITHPEVTR
jgi:hypothetical protein